MSGSASLHRDGTGRVAIGAGPDFELHEWTGGGSAHLHFHHADDEPRHVISGRPKFRCLEGMREAGPRSTVYVPAGVPRDYDEVETSRYLTILTSHLRASIETVHATPREGWADAMADHAPAFIEAP